MKTIIPLRALGALMLIGASSQVDAVMHNDAGGVGQTLAAHVQASTDQAAPVYAQASTDSTKKDAAGSSSEKPASPAKKATETAADKLDRGIGPVKAVKLDSISEEMVATGKQLFTQKCTVCHQLDTKKVGPPLRDVAKRETPEFIMNMILNPNEMEKKNATVKKLISQYQTYMSITGITEVQARAMLEYLRWAAEQPK